MAVVKVIDPRTTADDRTNSVPSLSTLNCFHTSCTLSCPGFASPYFACTARAFLPKSYYCPAAPPHCHPKVRHLTAHIALHCANNIALREQFIQPELSRIVADTVPDCNAAQDPRQTATSGVLHFKLVFDLLHVYYMPLWALSAIA